MFAMRWSWGVGGVQATVCSSAPPLFSHFAAVDSNLWISPLGEQLPAAGTCRCCTRWCSATLCREMLGGRFPSLAALGGRGVRATGWALIFLPSALPHRLLPSLLAATFYVLPSVPAACHALPSFVNPPPPPFFYSCFLLSHLHRRPRSSFPRAPWKAHTPCCSYMLLW